MSRQNLASMTLDALLKLRDDIGTALSRRADVLKKELASLGSDYARVGPDCRLRKKENEEEIKSRGEVS